MKRSKTLELLQEKFYPSLVEEIKNDYKTDYLITSSTGELSVSSKISSELLTFADDLDKIIKSIKRRHHFELEKTITQKRYMENNYYLYGKNQIIVDSVCPRDKTFLVVHPEEFKRLLFEGVIYRDVTNE